MATKASNMLVHVGRGSMVSRRTMSTAQKSGSGRQGTRKPLRSVVFASQAILVGVGAGSMAYTVAKMDLDVVKTMVNVFMPKEILNDASSNPDSIAPSRPGGFRLDTATDIQFPVELKLTTPGPLLTLVGLGVRTVSFLRVKVYSAGFYIEQSKSESLRNVPGWNNYTASHLLTTPVGGTDSPQLSGEALMRNLLDDRVSCAIRIVRNTDFGHLRDGFTRAIAARQKLARSKNQLSEQDEERIAQSTQTLKALFPAQSVPKGKALTLLRTSNGVLTVEYEGKILGQVNDAWMSRELMLAYFADKDVISNKLKEDVAKGFEEFIKP